MENKNERTTVYVGDLSLSTYESDIYKVFSLMGNVTNIKLIKPTTETAKLKYNTCYAYVTYENYEEASQAVKKLNLTKLNGVEIRVMFYDKLKMKGQIGGNIVVKNLDDNVDSKTLYDTFQVFGDILSCKVAVNSEGKSKGFGFVQYTTKIAAKKAVKYGNGCICGACEVKVELYDKNKIKNKENKFTNVYMKNFPLSMTEEGLKEILEKYGEVNSLFLPKDDKGKVKGFAFANFTESKSAIEAVENLHDKYIFEDEDLPEPFYIQKAQSKAQREEELRRSIEKLTISGQNYKRNLYVTNIPITYTGKDIKEIFSKFGNIISIHLDRDTISDGSSNYAFICFKTPDEACIALEKGNELIIDGFKLNVVYFKSKQDRLQEKSLQVDNIPQYGYTQNLLKFKKPEDKRVYPFIIPDKKQMNKDLYNLVLTTATSFKSKWEKLGIENEKEFADKVTDILMDKSSKDIRNMVGLGNVLNANIEAVLDYLKNIKKNKK